MRETLLQAVLRNAKLSGMQLLEYLKEERGRASLLAAALGVSPVLISQWGNKQRPVPAARCPDIERHTAGAVTCEELLPDVDWGYLRGSDQTRRIDTPEAVAAAFAIPAQAPPVPESPASQPDPDAGRVESFVENP